jgi:hypothetical protein
MNSHGKTQKTIDPLADLRKAKKLIVKLRKERKEWMESWAKEWDEKIRYKNNAKKWEESFCRLTDVIDRMVRQDLERFKKEHEEWMLKIQKRMNPIFQKDHQVLISFEQSAGKYVYPDLEDDAELFFEDHRN